MEFKETTTPSHSELEFLFNLWNSEYPIGICFKSLEDLEGYLNGLEAPKHVFMSIDGQAIGWFCDFMRDDERNFAMIMSKEFQGKGHGSALLTNAKSKYSKLSGWVVDQEGFKKADGSPYLAPVNFYTKKDFRTISDVRIETSVLSAVKIIWEQV